MASTLLCDVCYSHHPSEQVRTVTQTGALFIRNNCKRPEFKIYDRICQSCRELVERKFAKKPIANKVFALHGDHHWSLVDKKPMITNEAMNNGSSRYINNELSLQLQFDDGRSPNTRRSRFSSTDTVAQVIKSVDKQVSLPNGVDNLTLLWYSIDNARHPYSFDNLEQTLEQLKLKDNSVLRFGYRHKQKSIVKSLRLRVKWLLRQQNMSFDYTDNTTVGELIHAIRNEFKINSPIEEIELETSYGLIGFDDLEKKLATSSAIPKSEPTIFLSLKNDKTTPTNIIIRSAMDGIVSTVVTTHESSKSNRKICMRLHCLFSNHILILVMSLNETIRDLKQCVIDDHTGKSLDIKTIELGVIKPHRKLDLPDHTSLADAKIETETHLYADHILNKFAASKSNSCMENRHETTTIVSQAKPTAVGQLQLSSTEKNPAGKTSHSLVQSSKNNTTNPKSVNKSIAETNSFSNNLSLSTVQTSVSLPTRVLLIGLSNHGNACFMNSALQCLAHVPGLVLYFLTLFHERQYNTPDHTDLRYICDVYGETIGAFAYLMYQLWEGLDRPINPNQIKTLVSRTAPRFITDRQQDVQEFLTYLLDCLDYELKQSIDFKSVNGSKTIIEQQFFGAIESRTICSMCQAEEATINMISFLPLPLERQERLFTILYVPLSGDTQTHRISAFSTDRMEHVLNNLVKETRFLRQHRLSVSTYSSSNSYIPPKTSLNEIFDYRLIVREEKTGPFFTPSSIIEQWNSAPLELMDCLKEFLALELLEGSWFCKNQCKIEVESPARKMYLCQLPPVLIFQLKRFSEENGRKYKIDKKVTFPINGLDLSGLLPEKYATSSTPIYDLIAVSNHIGTIYGGHYTTYARLLREDQWYDFDDTRVSKIYSSDVITNNAYLLFYLRRDARF